MKRTKTCGELTKKDEGKEATLCGWTHSRRDHGSIIFVDLRDRYGLTQIVFDPKHVPEVHKEAQHLRREDVIQIKGKVRPRGKGLENPKLKTGEIEVLVDDLNILNKAETPPLEIDDRIDVNEDMRLKYRYIDLRKPRMQQNLIIRHKVAKIVRDFYDAEGFLEIETPMLAKSTPEGARDYLVPSRVNPGKFFALPQSPQLFKQLCMVAGFEKYFQIARCMRDEDTRGDRQPEFTQLDFEMSFVKQEDVLSFTEGMFIALIQTLYPSKKITSVPFPRITYKESLAKYGSDKPDMRNDKSNNDELAFAWVVDFPMFEKDDSGKIQAAHHPFCSIKEEDEEKFMKGQDLFSIRANSYDLVLNGYELSSGSIRIHKSDMQQKVFELLNISKEEQQKKFGHMLEAFKFGAPPHGGFAPGIDRTVMLLQNEPNIREVIAFAKTGEGRDLMMGAPSEVSRQQLMELGISLKKDKK